MTAARTVVIGGGQAGLATARCLQRRGIEPLVLDANPRVGDTWRNRYDSLVLLTPAQYDGLPDLPFPAPPDTHPSKDDAADYLESYATRFDIEVHNRCRVERLTREGADGPFRITTSESDLEAATVVVATGALQHPSLPSFADQLPHDIAQLHSSQYRNPGDVEGGHVLVVGAGNSGGQIAEELADHVDTTISYERLPTRLPQRLLGKDIFWWLQRWGVLDRSSERAGGPAAAVGSIPLIGTKLPKLVRTGAVARVGRITGASPEGVQLADGTSLRPDTVVWATGFRNDFSWVDIAHATDRDGNPNHHRGISTTIPGLAFIGLPGLHTKGSAFLGFVGRDADHLAATLASVR